MLNRPEFVLRESNDHFWKYEIINTKRPDGYPHKFQTKEEAEEALERYQNTYYISYYSEDEIKAFVDSIDFEVLFKAINDYLGTNLTFNLTKMEKRRGEYFWDIESNENLCDLFPILSKAWSEMKVDLFSRSINCNKETGELYLWGTVHYSYEHLGSGGNGAALMDVHYKESAGGWKFLTERERYERRNRREEDYE